MPLFTGNYYSRNIRFKNADGTPIDVTGWQFRAQIRDSKDSAVLAELTTGDGITVVDGPAGHVLFAVSAAISEDWSEGRVVFDVQRTDVVPGPVLLFTGRFKVAHPVTRNE